MFRRCYAVWWERSRQSPKASPWLKLGATLSLQHRDDMPLLDGEVMGGFSRARLEAAIGSGLKQEFHEFNIAIIGSQMKRRISGIRGSGIRRTSPRDQQPHDVVAPSSRGCVDRQVRFVVTGYRQHGRAGIE